MFSNEQAFKVRDNWKSLKVQIVFIMHLYDASG